MKGVILLINMLAEITLIYPTNVRKPDVRDTQYGVIHSAKRAWCNKILIWFPEKRKTNGRRSQQKAIPPMTDNVQIMLRATSFEMFETYNFVSLKFNLPVSCFRMKV